MSSIVAGKFKGHPLPNTKLGQVRPTSNRTRTILFDTLGSLQGDNVLDLFSGLGTLGFEAMSRGAEKLTSIDQDYKYIKLQKEWISLHKLDIAFSSRKGNVNHIIKSLDNKYDTIFVDPPYQFEPDNDFWRNLFNLVSENGRVVYEAGTESKLNIPDEIISLLIKEKTAGQTRLLFFEKG
jgi:16S rRNA (guanine966-N2)-methyltransferase